MPLRNSSCKTLKLFCPTVENISEDETLNVDFFSSSQLEYPKKTFNKALCLSGGGAGAFTLSISVMTALEVQEKLNNFDTIGSVSGGSWANALFQYGKYESRQDFLGNVLEPQNITSENVGVLSKKCVRICTDNEDAFIPEFEQFIEVIGGKKISEAWKYLLSYYTTPFSLDNNKFFSYDENSVDKILENQSILSKDDFILPSKKLPYPIFFSTIEGPLNLEPYDIGINSEFIIFEMSPLYTGIYNPLTITYKNTDNKKKDTIALNNYSNSTTFKGKLIEDNKAIINNRFDIVDAMALSSWALGSFVDSIPLLTRFEDQLYTENLFNKTKNNEFLFSDGGTIDNSGIIPMVQRNYKSIVSCVFSNIPFNNIVLDDYNSKNSPMDSMLTCLFGINTL